MTGKAAAIPACDHRRQRVRVHEEHERHVHRGERYEDPHRPEVPVARRLEAAEQPSEPAAQPAPGGELRVVEGAREVRAAAVPETGICLVDLQPARDHAGEQDDRGPMRQPHDPVVAPHAAGGGGQGGGRGRDVAHRSNIFPEMKYVITLALVAACQLRPATKSTRPADTLDLSRLGPPNARDSALLVPRVVTGPSVVLFWLPAADTLTAADQAQAFDDLKYYTEQVAPTLAANGIELLSTNSDTVYVPLSNKQRRTVLLSGLDYPFGYLLVDPGGPERILTGVYEDAELLDELRAYFDLADDSLPPPPRVTT